MASVPSPNRKKALRWTAGVLGALLLSALGSGVWESMLAPVFHTMGRWTLDVLSLGLKSYKDGVYAQVARDNQSQPALEVLFLITLLYIMMYMGFFLFSLWYDAVGSADLDSDNTAVPVLRMMIRVSKGKWYRRMTFFFIVIFPVLLISQLVKLSYVSSADAHYHQVLRIASPYLEATDRTQVESDFARVSNRDEYVNVLSNLESRCKAKGMAVPKFDPW